MKTLKPNDTVRIIAPAANTNDASAQLERCCAFIRSLGLQPEYSANIFGTYSSYYIYANSDELRYLDFIDALNSSAEAIWCFRGGYGSDRVIQHLIKNHIAQPATEKLFIGFSDITNMHSYINNVWNWPTLHGPALRQLGEKSICADDETALIAYLFNRETDLSLPVTPLNDKARAPGAISSSVSGGNFTTLQCAIGTPWATQMSHKILLLEDVGESAYRLARMFYQLIHSGMIEACDAILLGDFIPDEQVEVVIQEFAAMCPVPLLQNKRISHGAYNFPIPLNSPTELTLGTAATIRFTGTRTY